MGRKAYKDKVLNSSGVSSKPFQSEFGASFLSKFGWEQGQGLGKKSDGVLEPVQIKRRTENLGLGAEKVKADQWTPWWEDQFNKIASERKDTHITPPPKEEDDDDESSSSSSDEEVVSTRLRGPYEKSVFMMSGYELMQLCLS